jgi:chromosome segregation ATPase
MKNVIGKIFVFAVFAMSLMLMSFAIAIYSSHVNWQDEAKKTKDELDKLKLQETALNQEITRLTRNVASSEAARDQVIAKFQQALVEKDKELKTLKEARDEKLSDMQEKVAALAVANADLKEARAEVDRLRTDIDKKQEMVDSQVTRAAEIAAELHEKDAFLEIANERRAQLEKQVSQARILLKQNGLSIDSLPKDRVPSITGVVMAVAVLLREFSRGIVQRGDKVTTRLKA